MWAATPDASSLAAAQPQAILAVGDSIAFTALAKKQGVIDAKLAGGWYDVQEFVDSVPAERVYVHENFITQTSAVPLSEPTHDAVPMHMRLLTPTEVQHGSWSRIILCVCDSVSSPTVSSELDKRLALCDGASKKTHHTTDTAAFDLARTQDVCVRINFASGELLASPSEFRLRMLRDLQCLEVDVQATGVHDAPITVTGTVAVWAGQHMVHTVSISVVIPAAPATSAADTKPSGGGLAAQLKRLQMRSTTSASPAISPIHAAGSQPSTPAHAVGTPIEPTSSTAIEGVEIPATPYFYNASASEVEPVPAELCALLKLLTSNTLSLLKHGRNGRAVQRTISSKDGLKTLTWGSEPHYMNECTECRRGTDKDPEEAGDETGTSVLRKSLHSTSPTATNAKSFERSFSLIFKNRSLDFTAATEEQAVALVAGFRQFLQLQAALGEVTMTNTAPGGRKSSVFAKSGHGKPVSRLSISLSRPSSKVGIAPEQDNNNNSAKAQQQNDTEITDSAKTAAVAVVSETTETQNAEQTDAETGSDESSAGDHRTSSPTAAAAVVTSTTAVTSSTTASAAATLPVSHTEQGDDGDMSDGEPESVSHIPDSDSKQSAFAIALTKGSESVPFSVTPHTGPLYTDQQALEQLTAQLTTGLSLLKHSRNGFMVARCVKTKDDMKSISWGRESYRLSECSGVKTGAEVLEHLPKLDASLVDRSFSLMFAKRSLDFTCASAEEMEKVAAGFSACLVLTAAA